MKNYNPIIFTNDLRRKFDETNYQNQITNELSTNIINTSSLEYLARMEKMSKKGAKNKHKPWLTQGILNSIKIKTRWLKNFLKSKITAHYKTYKLYRDKLNSLIRASIRNHYKQYFTQHKQNSKKTWNGINELLGNKRKTLQDNISLCINNEIITDQKQIVNTLNKYFIEIGENLSAKLGIPANTIDHYLNNPNKDNFYINPTTPEEVLKLINNPDPIKPTDIYNISPKLVRDSKYF